MGIVASLPALIVAFGGGVLLAMSAHKTKGLSGDDKSSTKKFEVKGAFWVFVLAIISLVWALFL